MKKYAFLTMALGLSLSAFAALPERVVFKTKTTTLTEKFEFALEDGVIHYREVGGKKWEEFPVRNSHKVVSKLVEISADGENLIGVDEDDRIYYMKIGRRKWMRKWGMPFRRALFAPESNRALAISHRGPFAGGYEDIDGNFHKIGAGVTTLYALSSDGLEITYADPWLPAVFGHSVCAPEEGRFISESLSASASTIFVINRAGRMYTRLADFDTVGNNPFLRYSFEEDQHKRKIRSLPGEDWHAQPIITSGKITKKITIVTTGKGNSSRELRVEGINAEGVPGFFKKKIFDSEWAFVPHAHEVEGPFMDQEEISGPVRKRNLEKVSFRLNGTTYTGRLFDYNPGCGPSRLVLESPHEAITLQVHHLEGLFKERNWLVVPEQFRSSGMAREIFGNNKAIAVKLSF